jgi:hypothetical protein
VSGVLIGIITGRHPHRRSWVVLGIIAGNALAWTAVLALPTPAPYWLLVVLVTVISSGGPGSVVGFDIARTFNPGATLGTAQGAVNVLYRGEIAASDDPETLRKELINEYTETLSNPYAAAERGTIDSVIEPEDSRAYITKAFRTLKTKRDILPARKHGNIPL